MDAVVSHNPARSRFEVHVGEQLVGVAEYVERPGIRAFTHTSVDAAHQGQGLAGKLITQALADSQRARLAVLPFCEYVSTYIARHEEFAELVPPPMHHYFEL